MNENRKRRIAADEAHAWARNLRLGNPLAKLVLCMLSLYVNDRGECYPSLRTLADDCELSITTVRERLKWLSDEAKVIKRMPQWIGEGGARNSEGRGRQTSDLIILLIPGAEAAQPEILDDDEMQVSGPPQAEGSADDLRTTSVSVTPHLRAPPDSLNLNLKKKDARARARVEPRAPARKRELQFVCKDTEWWREVMTPYLAVRGRLDELKAVYWGDGEHRAHNGRYFWRDEVDAALKERASARGPPDADSVNEAGTESEPGPIHDVRQSAASLSGADMDHRAADRLRPS